MLRFIETPEKTYYDIPTVKTLPEIGSKTNFYPFEAVEYKSFEPISVPPQRYCGVAQNYDFYLVTYKPVDYHKNVKHLIAVLKEGIL